MQGIHLEEYYKLIISPIKKNRLINKNYTPNNNSNNIKISFNINDNTSTINEQSENKKININMNKSYNNSINDTNNEINNNDNYKFQIPMDIFNSNKKDNDKSVDGNDKSEIISRTKSGKKGKNNKRKKNNNFVINLDEKDES